MWWEGADPLLTMSDRSRHAGGTDSWLLAPCGLAERDLRPAALVSPSRGCGRMRAHGGKQLCSGTRGLGLGGSLRVSFWPKNSRAV